MISMNTERLMIRDYLPEDQEGLYQLLSSETEMYFLPDLKVSDREGARENLRVAMDEAASRERGKHFFALLAKDDGRYIGSIGFTEMEAETGGKQVEMGYFIREREWSRGYVTEAGRRIIQFAFEECGIARILIGCYRENAASERVMIKLGFVKQREYEGAVHHEGASALRVEYAMTKGQWENMAVQ
jgi:[ribosomal protein S5]-alanine N-acetyltransferase